MRLNLLEILCLLVFSSFYSQVSIYGKIEDQNGKPIQGAQIHIENKNKETVAFKNSNFEGKFSFNEIQINDVASISVRHIDYKKETKTLSLSENSTSTRINFQLKPNVLEIQEVIIQEKKNIKVNNDTISIQTKAFAKGDETVVEDLLKRIPGLNVTDDGKIKVGNQEVEKILIDGDDFFGKGYSMLSKNMPAYPIEQIDILKRYTHNKLLKGFENSDKIALNLKLKDEYKNIIFGNLLATQGFFPETRYHFKGNLIKVAPKNKYYFLSGINDLGVDNKKEVQQFAQGDVVEEKGYFNENNFPNKIISNAVSYPSLGKERFDSNVSKMLAFSMISHLSPKTNIQLSGTLLKDKNTLFRERNLSFKDNDYSFINFEKTNILQNELLGNIKLILTSDINNNESFYYSGKFDSNKDDIANSIQFNDRFINDKIHNRTQNTQHFILYTNKIDDRNLVLVSGRWAWNQLPEFFSTQPSVSTDWFNFKFINANQRINQISNYANAEINWIRKNNEKNQFDVQLGVNYQNSNFESELHLENHINSYVPDMYKNDFSYTNRIIYLEGKYQWNPRNFRISFLPKIQNMSQMKKIENYVDEKNKFVFTPKVELQWHLNETNKINATYSFSTQSLNLPQVIHQPVLTQYNYFYKGVQDLDFLNSTAVRISYLLGDWGSRFFSYASLFYNKNHDYISSSSVISQTHTSNEFIITKNRNLLNANIGSEYYVRKIKSNLKIFGSLSDVSYMNQVNSQFVREVNSINGHYGGAIQNNFLKKLNVEIGYKNMVSSVIKPEKRTFNEENMYINTLLSIHNRLQISFNANYYHFSQELHKNKYWLMDSKVKYIAVPNVLSFELSGRNITNQKVFNEYQISDTSWVQNTFSLRPRYILLNVEYRF